MVNSDFKVSFNPRSGTWQVWAKVKPHGPRGNLTRKLVKNFRSEAEALAWIRNHGSGWFEEHEAHSDAARLGHLKRRGY